MCTTWLDLMMDVLLIIGLCVVFLWLHLRGRIRIGTPETGIEAIDAFVIILVFYLVLR